MKMDAYIKEFPEHLREIQKIIGTTTLKPSGNEIQNVLILGLGGSGIGGRIAASLVYNHCPVPVTVCSDYSIPDFSGKNTLVIACSYSGNTEETLISLESAAKKGCTIACITSGGKLEQVAAQNGYNLILIPKNYPPRTALGYSLPAIIHLLCYYGLSSIKLEKELKAAIELITVQEAEIKESASVLAQHLSDGVPVIYSEAVFEAVAVRFRQQVNENAKMLCWHHALPEMNHNELVGWGGGDDRFRVVAFRSDLEHVRTKTRMELCQGIIEKKAAYREIFANGNSLFTQFIYLIHLGDWTSWYLSEIRKVDAVEVNVIDYLKGELARTK
jgi:glucose/mannose-6-phosphate isomerase